MKAKIGYLVNESYGWDEGPEWKFYSEEEVPSYKIQYKNSYKRIVYFEVE